MRLPALSLLSLAACSQEADTSDLEARMAALESAIADVPAPVDLTEIEARLAALEALQPTIGTIPDIDARVAAIESDYVTGDALGEETTARKDADAAIFSEVDALDVRIASLEAAPSGWEAPLHDALAVGAWSFDDGSGDWLVDESGGGHHGEIVGATWAADGLEFDGVDDHVDVGSDEAFDAHSGLTAEATVWIDGLTGDYQVIAGRWYEEGVADSSWVLELHPDGVLDFSVYGVAACLAPTALVLGDWVHVAGTYDGEAIRLFADGVEVASCAATGTLPETDAPLVIGAHDSTDDRNPLFGALAQLRVFNRALDDADIATLAASW